MGTLRLRWVQGGGVVIAALALAALWKWTPMREWAEPERLAAWLEPYRSSWIALPISVAVFVVAELFLFPVVVLIFVCGLAFGPWMGTLCALCGALASAIPPFLIGRRLGRETVERMGGPLARKLAQKLDGRGVIAVFIVRKIPAPYSLVNLVCGASPISLRDFLLGTLLGMGTGTVILTVLAGQLGDLLRDPSPGRIAIGVALLLLPLFVALVLQRNLNRRVARAQ